MTTTSVCVTVIVCMIVVTLLGVNLFLLPFYALSGRVLTLNCAIARCRKGRGTLYVLRGGGLLDRIWWSDKNPKGSIELRICGSIVLGLQSETQLRQVLPQLKTLRTTMYGMVDPVKLEKKS